MLLPELEELAPEFIEWWKSSSDPLTARIINIEIKLYDDVGRPNLFFDCSPGRTQLHTRTQVMEALLFLKKYCPEKYRKE